MDEQRCSHLLGSPDFYLTNMKQNNLHSYELCTWIINIIHVLFYFLDVWIRVGGGKAMYACF